MGLEEGLFSPVAPLDQLIQQMPGNQARRGSAHGGYPIRSAASCLVRPALCYVPPMWPRGAHLTCYSRPHSQQDKVMVMPLAGEEIGSHLETLRPPSPITHMPSCIGVICRFPIFLPEPEMTWGQGFTSPIPTEPPSFERFTSTR